jgi:spermidine synthase
MRPWRTIDRTETPEGQLELRQRGEQDFLITIAGRVLMTSKAHRSEDELARLSCAALAGRARVLLGGLGMGHTLRAALDGLPSTGRITVVEISPRVVAWCRGPLAVLTDGATADHRVDVVVDDVAAVIARAPAGGYDAIILDLYEGPHEATRRAGDPLYGARAIERMQAAVAPGGVVAIWSEEADPHFEARLAAGEFRVERIRSGSGGRRHIIYLGTRLRRGQQHGGADDLGAALRASDRTATFCPAACEDLP